MTLDVKGAQYLGVHIRQEGPFVGCAENGEWVDRDRAGKDLGLMSLSVD